MAAGGELIIDDKLVRAIHDMEKALQGVTKEADATQRKTMAWLSSLSSGNIDAFTNKIKQLESNYMNLVNALSNVQGFENLSEKALNTAGAITQLITVMGQNTPKKTDGFDSIRQTLDSLLAQLAKARQDIDLYYQAIGTGKKEYIEFGQTGLKEAEARAESLMRKIEALNTTYQQLKQSSFNITDLTKGTMDDERNRIELSGIKMRLQEEERVHKAVMEHNLEELKAINDKIEAGIQGEKALAKAEEEQARVDKYYHDKRQREYDEMFKAIERNENRQRAINAKYGDSSKGALNYSNRLYSTNGVRSIQNMETALNKLRDAQRRLNVGTEEGRKRYAELGAQIKKIEGDLNRVTNASERMKKSHSGLINTGQQLARQLALVFSVSQIEGYANKLVSVRKEFEMQQRSLQVLLRDKDEANQLWNQTIQLAVQSPLRVKELVTYTKQLAAYRIESEKLHDTTKMLADVSAGLGVDMNRLILAFGQVRAAEFLRGTELRQFTEAGIPMLEELADHFTELEGRAVSTADVFARISKRMVTFEDVEQVFKKVTSEGGTFYRMQEEQSKTLSGMISNLHDSIDLMMNDIGQSNESVLKGAVELTKTLVDNWRAVASVMEVVGTSLAIKGLTLFVRGFRAASAHALLATTNFRGLALAGAKVNGAMKAIHATLMAHPWYAVAAAVLIATKGLYDYNKSIQQHNKKYDDLSKRELSRIDRLKEISKEVENNNATIKDNKSTQEELNKAQLANSKVLEELKKKFPDLYDGLVQQKNGTIELSNAIEAQNALLQINIALQQASKGGWFQQDMETNYTQVYEAQKKMEDSLGKIKIAASNVRLELLNMLREKSVPQNIASPIQKLVEEIGDSEDLDYATSKWKELSIYLQSIYTQGYRLGNLKWDLGGAFVSAHKSIIGYDNALKDLYDNLDNGMVRFKEGVEWALSMGGNEAATKWLNTMLMSLGIVDEKIKKEAREYITSKINIKLEFGDDKKEYTEDDLKEEWKKKVWNAIKAVQEANPEIALGITLKTMVEGDKSSIIPKLQESVKNAIDATTKDLKGADLDGQVVFTDDQMDKMEKSIPLLENLANLIALVRDTKGSGGDKKDWFAEMGRAIRDTHKDFLTLHKDLDKTRALELAMEKHSDVFAEAAKGAKMLGLSLRDFSSLLVEDNAISALEDLLERIPETAAKSRLAIEKMIGELKGGEEVREAQERYEELNSQIEKLFGTYELSLELKDMNIPKDLANRLFGFESIDLTGLRQKVLSELAPFDTDKSDEEIIKKLKKQVVDENRIKLTEDTLKKIADLEDKALKERMKKYTKYLLNGQSELAKIRLEEARKLIEINETFIRPEDAEYKQQAREGVRNETKEALDKYVWESFKESEYYEMMFSDLKTLGSKALDILYKRLRELSDSLDDLPPHLRKQMQQAMMEVKNEADRFNPFKGLIEAYKAYRKSVTEGVTIKDKEGTEHKVKGRQATVEEYEKQVEKQTLLDDEIAKLQKINILKQNGVQLSEEDMNTLQKSGVQVDDSQTEQQITKGIEQTIKERKKEKKIIDANVKTLANQVNVQNESAEAIQNNKKHIGDWAKEFVNVLEGADALLDALGVAEDDSARLWIQNLMHIGEMIIAFAAMEVQANSALGVIGYIAMALKAIATIFASIFAAKDNRLKKQIENIEDKVESLRKAYEKLEKQMDEAYNLDSISDVAKKGQKNLEEQIDATYKMIELERQRKNQDEDKIKDWQDEIEDAREQMKELEIERRQALGGLGGQADYKSASEEFVSAWLEAFRETGDGMKGLEEQYDEMITNMITKQLTTRVAEKVLAPFYSYFDSMFAETSKGGARVTEDELRRLEQLKEDSLMQMNDQLSALSTIFGKDIMGQVELGTLQKGIQGITENQADILASYLNTIRFFVAEQNSYLQDIAMAQGVSQGNNPIVEQLRVVAEQTSAIHELLDSLLVPHPTQSGRGLKVVI